MSLILVVDDEPALLDVVSDFVEMIGHDVVRAHDGEEALALVRTRKPALVITDHMMPRRTGIALANAIRSDERLRDIPIVIMSAVHPAGIDPRDVYIKKPFDLGDLERIVRSSLHQEPRIVGEAHQTEAARIPLDGEEMAQWLAHEVKQPVAAAKALLQLADRTVTDATRTRELIGRAGGLLDRIDQLVHSLLDAARLSEGTLNARPVEGDMVAFLEERVRELRNIEPGATLIVKVPSHPVEATFDPMLLGQLVSNLVVNAAKHAGSHEPIEVRMSASDTDVTISVKDHGRGIPAGEIPHLFDRFRSGRDGDGHGHGLGLFIASQVARLHGGELHVDSEVGVGSTFTVRLPRLVKSPTAAAST